MLTTAYALSRRRTNALDVFRTVYLEDEEDTQYDVIIFFSSTRYEFRNLIEEAIEEKKTIKKHLLLKVNLEKISAEGEEEISTRYFHSDTVPELTIENIEEYLEKAHSKIIKSLEKYTARGYGWRLKEIIYFEHKLAKQDYLRGSSYLRLPQKLQGRKAILNMEDFHDEKCFLWCILAYKLNLLHGEHPERVAKYQHYKNEFKMDDVSYPVANQKVKQIEKKYDLLINVYGYKSD